MKKTTNAIFILPFLLFLTWTIVNSKTVFADGKYDIKEMTPAVKAALENRRNRFEQLRNLKAKGFVGENNRGYAEVLEDKESARSLVDSENADRRVIYQAIEQQNNLSGEIDTIEKVFAQVQRDKANPGDKIQNENGQWVAK